MNKSFEKFRFKVLNGLSIVSIALCTLTLILWPLSYASGVQISVRNGAGTRYALVTVPGQVGVVTVRGEARASVSLDGCTKSFGSEASPLANTKDKLRWFWRRPPAGKLGFVSDQGSDTIYFGEANNSFLCTFTATFVPIWLISILTFIGPILWYQSRRRRQYRIDNDLCTHCGSDMTTSPYRCPTCGREQTW